MDEFRFLGRALASRGYAARRQEVRTTICAVEHETVPLPTDLSSTDGRLDLYEDVQKLFRPVFANGRPAVQCSGWLGYIPLNDNYALEVNPRVPIDNLERIIGIARGYTPKLLEKYTRYFAHTVEQPPVLFDIITDQLLLAFEHAWEAGLIKNYNYQKIVGSSPVGRIDPFDTAWLTRKSGRPTASSSAFFRSSDTGPNRVIRHALEKLLQRYLQDQDSKSHKSRLLRLRRCLDRLGGVNRPSPSDASPRAIAQYIYRLPAYHEHYADVLILSQLIIADAGPSIRGSNHVAILPTILIDMATVYENYIRHILAQRLSEAPEFEVRDGNKGGKEGAKMELFDNLRAGLNNRAVTPDIVISVENIPRLIIDVKYKPPNDIPDRADINQVILYGTRYDCRRVMVVYAGRHDDQKWINAAGDIGTQTLYTGHLNLAADRIEDEEKNFTNAVLTLLAA